MNANELADDLEKYDWYYEHEVTGSDGYTQEIKTCNTEYVWDAAAMLRQQQTEIEALKSEIVSIEKNTDYWADKANWIKNNKPLAWMQTWENQDGELKKTVNIEQIGKNDIPLYTNPAELTDEEIIILWNDLVDRTVLRKASEK